MIFATIFLSFLAPFLLAAIAIGLGGCLFLSAQLFHYMRDAIKERLRERRNPRR